MFYSVSEHCQECKRERERERERAEGFEVFKKVELSGIQIEVEKNENVSSSKFPTCPHHLLPSKI